MAFLPDVDYVGFDSNTNYIQVAKARHGGRGTFHVCDINTIDFSQLGGGILILLSPLEFFIIWMTLKFRVFAKRLGRRYLREDVW